jgi:hypothetical protein
MLTSADAQRVIDSLCGSGQRLEPIQVISAFRTPKLRYDPIRKVFFPQKAAQSLHGTAEVSNPSSVSVNLLSAFCNTFIHLTCSVEEACNVWMKTAIQKWSFRKKHIGPRQLYARFHAP